MLSSNTKAYSDYHINSFYEQYKGGCCKRASPSKLVHSEYKNSPWVPGQYSDKTFSFVKKDTTQLQY